LPVDAVLASVHFRVDAAGRSLEHAASFLRSRQVFRAAVEMRQAAQDLSSAQAMVKASGKYPALESYLGNLAAFYHGKVAQSVRPMGASALADEIAAQQGNLLAADPVLTPSSAH